MERKYIVGIDPGSDNGGIAVLESNGDVIDVTNMPETPLDIYSYLADTKKAAERDGYTMVVYLEDVGHGIPGQSSSATAKFARHNGNLEMALLALGVKTVKVTPQKWMKKYQLGSSKGFTKTEWKNKLKAKAQQLFPAHKVTLKTSDALLIAEYGRKEE